MGQGLLGSDLLVPLEKLLVGLVLAAPSGLEGIVVGEGHTEAVTGAFGLLTSRPLLAPRASARFLSTSRMRTQSG